MERTPLQQATDMIQTQYFEAMKARHTEVVRESIPADGQPPPPHRLVREPLIRHAVDDACREFARTGKFPLMADETAVFVWDRFEHAYALCGWAERQGVQFPLKSTADLLRLFLVEFWFYSGHLRWSSGWTGVLM